MEMTQKLNSVEQFVLLMEQNVNEVQLGVYSIAIVGLAAAIRRVRPFSRFTRPSDIPKRFIRTRTKLNGTVERIEPSGALLMVQHKPLFRILPSKVDSLPVKVSGITVNGNGISWLQSIVSGNDVTFVPVLKQNNYVECEVTMEQKTQDNKMKTLHVGPALVSVGFGKVDPIEKSLSKNGFHLAYYKTLKAAETLAERKRLGNWYYIKSSQELTQKLAKQLLTSTLALFKSRAKAVKSAKPTEKSTKVIVNPKIDVNKAVKLAHLTEKSTKVIVNPKLDINKVASA